MHGLARIPAIVAGSAPQTPWFRRFAAAVLPHFPPMFMVLAQRGGEIQPREPHACEGMTLMTKDRMRFVSRNLLISLALYPVVLLGVWGLMALGTFATNWHISADAMPLIYGLVFAVLTLCLVDILGIATVVLALVSIANLIEYAQLLVPGRTPSPVDFAASLAGVLIAAILVWSARALVGRHAEPDTAAAPALDDGPSVVQ